MSINNSVVKLVTRKVTKIVAGTPTSDGAGVKLTRLIGSHQLDMLDPFLLLDCFESDDPNDYIAGFPTHPHRGFETVTYLLNGKMRHKDSQGNEGVIESGGIQWMTAGKGILHSEMPEQENGLLKGFQLWINLPSQSKMKPPTYQEFPASQVPVEMSEGCNIRVITGTTNKGTVGPVVNHYSNPLYLDVSVTANTSFSQLIANKHAAFVYVVEGQITIENQSVTKGQLALLSEEGGLTLKANQESRLLLIAAKAMQEPVARYGPFVMNTQQELRKALDDYQQGKF